MNHTTDAVTGAMPGPSAMLEQTRQATARAAGPISWPRVLRDQEGSQSGATGSDSRPPAAPAATTTTPPAGATPPAQPPAAPPATGEEALGDAGTRILRDARAAQRAAEDRAKAAEEERDALKTAGQTDQEKALGEAKRTAATEERTKWQAHIRSSEVRAALTRAGITDEKEVALAAGAPEFGKLKVNDEGVVERLAETVDQFKKDYPRLFSSSAPAPRAGAWDGAAGGTTKPQPRTLEEAVVAEYSTPKR